MATNTQYVTSASDLPLAGTPEGQFARAGGWWTLILSVAMLGIMAEAIHAGNWSEGLQTIRVVVMGGAFLSFLLALTRWQAPFVTLYGMLASIVWITFWLVRVLLPGQSFHTGVQEVIARNADWLSALISGSANADNLVFVTQLAFLCWWLAFFAMWSIFRHQSVAFAAVPAAAALIVNLYFSPLDLRVYLLAFLVTVLLLAVRVELARNQSLWHFARIRYAQDISADFWRAGAVFALIVLGLSWLTPNINNSVTLERIMRPFEQPWRKVTDTWARMYESVTYPTASQSRTAYGRSMTLGGPVSLTDRPIFDGQVPTRSYWRAAVYDTYTGEGWVNTDPDVRIVERNQPLGEPGFFMYREITATVHPLESGLETIFAPPHPVRVSVPTDVDASAVDEQGTQFTVSLLRSRVPFGSDDTYSVVSAISLAPLDKLRGDGSDYPEWIRERFLQLPATTPQRVRDLAQEFAGDEQNAFDIASAVEARLREYTYNQDIAAPPSGADAVDYFLFDAQQGYCDYYASAMVVMLRSLGIPARFMVGYTPGEYIAPSPGDPANPVQIGKFRVLERNAHAWVEAYFPTYGWIQFEPTASEPVLTRPESLENLLPATTPTPPGSNDLEELADLRNRARSEQPGWSGRRRSCLHPMAARSLAGSARPSSPGWRGAYRLATLPPTTDGVLRCFRSRATAIRAAGYLGRAFARSLARELHPDRARRCARSHGARCGARRPAPDATVRRATLRATKPCGAGTRGCQRKLAVPAAGFLEALGGPDRGKSVWPSPLGH